MQSAVNIDLVCDYCQSDIVDKLRGNRQCNVDSVNSLSQQTNVSLSKSKMSARGSARGDRAFEGSSSNSQAVTSGQDTDDASSESSRLGMGGSSKKASLSKGSDEYKKRRERNNEAVKKSRQKSKLKTNQTQQRVDELANENAELSNKLTILNKEFELLKEMYSAHTNYAHGSQDQLAECLDVERLLAGDLGHNHHQQL